MSPKRMFLVLSLAVFAQGATGLQAQVPAAPPVPAAPADGITVDMMPITDAQLTSCRDQASKQLADEQDTLHQREHGQDNDKMKQGAIAGTTGAVTSMISKHSWWGNNNGANTASATGQTERTNRNSQDVASTTATSQVVGTDAYKQCVMGIKGPEYVHYRQTGSMTAPTADAVLVKAAAPAKPTFTDEGDGKTFVLVMPGQSDSKEVTLVPGSKNAYIEGATGDKYIVMPDGSVTHIAHHNPAQISQNKS